MKKKQCSPLAFLMDKLNISTVSLSRRLHVDSSLISKWRSGARTLSAKSTYFDEIINQLILESRKTDHLTLKSALRELNPLKILEEEGDIIADLRVILPNANLIFLDTQTFGQYDNGRALRINSFDGNNGHQQAVMRILDYALELSSPGVMLIIDSDEFYWLLENASFASSFSKKMNSLINRGFKAKILIHFSSYRERFVRFFETCNLLVFHRNIEWFYHESYNDNLINYSLFVLNKTRSLLSFTAKGKSSTLAFYDVSSVLSHEALANTIINQSSRLFINFSEDRCGDVVEHIRVIRKHGPIFSYLPAPVFVSAHEDLLREILEDNQIPTPQLEHCLIVNQRMRNMVFSQYCGLEDRLERIVQIFQLEEMLARAKASPFISCSLSLLGGKQVKVTKPQYARCLRNMCRALKEHRNLEVAFLSEEDGAPLPNIPEMNCWCKKNTWMVQMDRKGFRISDEVSIVNAASITLERCLGKIPPERKEKAFVIPMLAKFAEMLDEESADPTTPKKNLIL